MVQPIPLLQGSSVQGSVSVLQSKTAQPPGGVHGGMLQTSPSLAQSTGTHPVVELQVPVVHALPSLLQSRILQPAVALQGSRVHMLPSVEQLKVQNLHALPWQLARKGHLTPQFPQLLLSYRTSKQAPLDPQGWVLESVSKQEALFLRPRLRPTTRAMNAMTTARTISPIMSAFNRSLAFLDVCF